MTDIENDPLKIINEYSKCKKNKNTKKKLKFTCLTEDIILQLVNIYNNNFCSNNPTFCLKNKTIKVNNRDINNIYNELKYKLSLYNKVYSKELYWKKIKEFSHIFINNNFFHVTKMPTEWCSTIKNWRNSYINAPWLSNYDIDDVIIKYENKYKKFKFLGSIPIDFRRTKFGSCVLDLFSNSSKSWLKIDNNSNYCNFNPLIYKNKTHFGIVFNTDTSDGPGKHWMSMIFCVNPKNPYILFFDSACTYYNLHDEIKNFINNIKNIYPQLNFTVKYNKKQHQTSNSECGMYSIYFILTMLDADFSSNKKYNGIKFFDKYFDNDSYTIHDKLMILYRTKFFDASTCKKIHLENI